MYIIDAEKLGGMEPAYTDLEKTEKEALLERVYQMAGANEAIAYAPMYRTRKRKTKLWARVLIAAVVASLFLVTGLSAAGVDLSFNGQLLELFHPGSEAEKNLLKNSATDIGKSVERSGVKVEVTQVVGDRNSAYIAFDVSVDEALLAGVPEDAFFAFESIDFDRHSNSTSGWSWGGVQRSADDGLLHFILSTNSHTKMSGNTITLVLKSLTVDSDLLVDDTWTIDFKLDYHDNSVRLANATIPVMGEDVKVSDVYFSPLSLSFEVSGDIIEKLTDNYATIVKGKNPYQVEPETLDTFEYFKLYVDISITMKDGSVIDAMNDNQGMSGGDSKSGNGGYAFNIQFDRVIDPAEVAKITIGDAVVFGG